MRMYDDPQAFELRKAAAILRDLIPAVADMLECVANLDPTERPRCAWCGVNHPHVIAEKVIK